MRMTPVRIVATSFAAGALVFTAGFGVGRATEGWQWHSLPDCDWSKASQGYSGTYVCKGPPVPERLTPYACLISADRGQCDTIYARDPHTGSCTIYRHVKDGWVEASEEAQMGAADVDCPVEEF